jgi:hypothetical protein
MSQRPEQLGRLDAILGSARFAHEISLELSRHLLTSGAAEEEAAELVAESSRIAIVELPRLLPGLRRLASRWEDEALLDSVAAESSSEEIAAEMEAVEPKAGSLLRRQREVVARLRELAQT